jgi:hypothetical protein
MYVIESIINLLDSNIVVYWKDKSAVMKGMQMDYIIIINLEVFIVLIIILGVNIISNVINLKELIILIIIIWVEFITFITILVVHMISIVID